MDLTSTLYHELGYWSIAIPPSRSGRWELNQHWLGPFLYPIYSVFYGVSKHHAHMRRARFGVVIWRRAMHNDPFRVVLASFLQLTLVWNTATQSLVHNSLLSDSYLRCAVHARCCLAAPLTTSVAPCPKDRLKLTDTKLRFTLLTNEHPSSPVLHPTAGHALLEHPEELHHSRIETMPLQGQSLAGFRDLVPFLLVGQVVIELLHQFLE